MTDRGDPVVAEVEQAANAWMEACARLDEESLNRILAGEFTMVTSRGSQIDKDQ